ncbi:unnamed protein product [Moneuplotes crassus]|uniref:Uncharacterized protein n=1 Tax=Euplotes crassus TaxID=5936 RepID=A0AAD1Y0A6_EUPCR|nr:unnamed protein product [Moneuplotes crassus]
MFSLSASSWYEVVFKLSSSKSMASTKESSRASSLFICVKFKFELSIFVIIRVNLFKINI